MFVSVWDPRPHQIAPEAPWIDARMSEGGGWGAQAAYLVPGRWGLWVVGVGMFISVVSVSVVAVSAVVTPRWVAAVHPANLDIRNRPFSRISYLLQRSSNIDSALQ